MTHSTPDPDLLTLEHELAPQIRAVRLTHTEPDARRAWQKVEALRSGEAQESGATRRIPLFRGRSLESAGPPTSRVPFLRPWLGVAAVVLAVVGVGLVQRWQHQVANTGPASLYEYTTAPGERAIVTLDDGTRITLNAASRLRIPDGFGVHTRTVELDGEARFVVHANPSVPFIVQANGSSVRDLATDFVVRAYPGGANTTVAVRDGSVAVQSPTVTANNAVVVSAFERAEVAPDGRILTAAMPHPDTDFGWSEGRLVFRDLPLGEALVRLSRWYGMQFNVANPNMLQLQINAELPEQYDIELLRTVAATMRATLEVRDTVVTFVSQEHQ